MVDAAGMSACLRVKPFYYSQPWPPSRPGLRGAGRVAAPPALSAPTLPPSFDHAVATDLAAELARSFPDRSPGSPGAIGAARWVTEQLQPYGLQAVRDSFRATMPAR